VSLSQRLSHIWDVMEIRVAYLPHATENANFQYWQSTASLTKAPADQLSQQAEAARARARPRVLESWPPLPLRNPIGEILLSVSANDYVKYIERTHDVEAHRRLVQLQIKALQERVPLAQMPTWLAAQPPELRNPYTLQPMGWDAATQALVFEGRQPNTQNPEPRNVFRVPIGPVEAAAIANRRQ
jgi:hypothetical protein